MAKRGAARIFDVDDPGQAQHLGGPVGAGNPRSVLEDAARCAEPLRAVKVRPLLTELRWESSAPGCAGEHHPRDLCNVSSARSFVPPNESASFAAASVCCHGFYLPMLPNTASGEISLSKTEKYFKGEMSVFAECLEELGPELMEGRGRERDPNRPSPALGPTAYIAVRCRLLCEAKRLSGERRVGQAASPAKGPLHSYKRKLVHDQGKEGAAGLYSKV